LSETSTCTTCSRLPNVVLVPVRPGEQAPVAIRVPLCLWQAKINALPSIQERQALYEIRKLVQQLSAILSIMATKNVEEIWAMMNPVHLSHGKDSKEFDNIWRGLRSGQATMRTAKPSYLPQAASCPAPVCKETQVAASGDSISLGYKSIMGRQDLML
jgi:hypothetical protein